MPRSRFLLPVVAAALLLVPAALPAHAVNKDLIQLQAQVQQLQDSVARLQQSNDESMGVLKDLVQQTADAVNKMSVVINGLQLKMQNQQDAAGAKADQLSGQIQSLNDSLDELKARMGRMEKALGDIQAAQQSANAVLGNLPGANGSNGANGTNGGAASAGAPATMPPPQANNAGPTPGTPLSALANGETAQPTAVPAGGPSPGDMYRTAYGDYMAGKYPLATSEFQELIKAYPDDNLSGNAYFYIGEMDLRGNRPSAAIRDYDHVIEHYPDNAKIPAAHLHKGEALIATHQTEAGVRELRALMQRFPNSPEAAQAQAKVSALARR